MTIGEGDGKFIRLKGRTKERGRVFGSQEDYEDKNDSVEEGSPSTDMARKLQEAVERKKIKQNSGYTGNNPGTNGEVIQDLIKMGHITPKDVFDSSMDTRNEHIVNADKNFTDEDAETLVKTVYGDDVFERNDKQLKEITLGDVADSSQVKKASEQKKDGGEKNLSTDRKKATSAIDEQISQMKMRLKRLDDSSKQFNKVATAEQKEERTKEIEVLKRGIEDAENKKIELLVKEKARLEKKAEAQKLAEKEKKKGSSGGKNTRATSNAERARRAAAKKLNGVTPSSGLLLEEEAEHLARLNKQADPKSNGVKLSSGLLPDEEVEARLSAERRMASVKKEEKRAKKVADEKSPENPVLVPQAEAVTTVVEAVQTVAPDADVSKETEEQVEQLELPIEIIPNGPNWGTSREEPKKGSKEKRNLPKDFEEEIAKLRKRVDDARKEYVTEDYKNTNRWLKIKNFFRGVKQEKSADAEYYQAQYNNELIDLRNTELARIKNSGLQGKELNEALAGTLRYFKYDELVNVVNERTQVRAEHQGWPGKVMNMMENVGKSYNNLSFKQKMVTAGTMWGLAGVTGGASLLARRIFAGAGAAVALEATAEKISDKRQSKKAQKEAEQQAEILGQIESDKFNNVLNQDIFSLDEKLQKQKRDALFRKAAAFGIGFGSGYLFKEIFQMVHGNDAVDWMKEYFGGTVPASEDLTLPGRMGMPSVLPDAVQIKTNFVHDFVNQDITVQKGDSVWKISGRLADQLNLEGAPRTHFIDALKDKFGDVQLQAGEHINFSGHGISDDFVKHALEDSNALSPEQSAHILENNTRLTAFTEANPNVTLTDEVTKNILEGKTPKVSDLRSFLPPASVVELHEGVQAHTASGFRFGPQVDLEHQPISEAVSPEDIASEYGTRADGWYDQIFKAENVQVGDRVLGKDVVESLKIQDVLHDANLFRQGAETGYTTGLSRQEIANFAKFDINASNGKSILFDRAGFLRNNPNATILDYLKKIASLTRRGQRIGLYTSL